jgi:hypothetical protein
VKTGELLTSEVSLVNLLVHSFTLNGQVAQSVEQRTENPCVGGSIPSLATIYRFRVNSLNSETVFSNHKGSPFVHSDYKFRK